VFSAAVTDNDDAAVLVARCLLDCDAGKFRTLSSSIVVLRDCWDRFQRRHDPLPDVVLQRTIALERRMADNRARVSIDAVYRSLEMFHAVSPRVAARYEFCVLETESACPGFGKFEPSFLSRRSQISSTQPCVTSASTGAIPVLCFNLVLAGSCHCVCYSFSVGIFFLAPDGLDLAASKLLRS
jgi:hypothetical protein